MEELAWNNNIPEALLYSFMLLQRISSSSVVQAPYVQNKYV